jgi:transcriptional regulator with XRE-family HTH domain
MLIHFRLSPNGLDWGQGLSTTEPSELFHLAGGEYCQLSIAFADVPQFIKRLRMAKGLTQPELADLIQGSHYRKHTISEIESGRRALGLDLMLRILEALGCKVAMQVEFRIDIDLSDTMPEASEVLKDDITKDEDFEFFRVDFFAS